jgi:hypothetical protein
MALWLKSMVMFCVNCELHLTLLIDRDLPETPEQRKARLEKESERIDKWREMIKDLRAFEGKNPRIVCLLFWAVCELCLTFTHTKARRRIRKGIPQQFRGLAWRLFAGVPEQVKLNQGVYEACCNNLNVTC